MKAVYGTQPVRQEMIEMKRMTAIILGLFVLTACDNGLYGEGDQGGYGSSAY